MWRSTLNALSIVSTLLLQVHTACLHTLYTILYSLSSVYSMLPVLCTSTHSICPVLCTRTVFCLNPSTLYRIYYCRRSDPHFRGVSSIVAHLNANNYQPKILLTPWKHQFHGRIEFTQPWYNQMIHGHLPVLCTYTLYSVRTLLARKVHCRSRSPPSIPISPSTRPADSSGVPALKLGLARLITSWGAYPMGTATYRVRRAHVFCAICVWTGREQSIQFEDIRSCACRVSVLYLLAR